MLMSSVVVNVHMCVQEEEKRGQWGLSNGNKMRQLNLSMGLARVEALSFGQRITIPSKRVIFYTQYL
jgi:hypothetical protein